MYASAPPATPPAPAQAPAPPRASNALARAMPWVALLAAVALWFPSLGAVDVHKANDLGLVSEATPTMLAALGCLAIGFALALRLRPFSAATALIATLLLIATIHGLPALVEDAPRFPTAYLHAGFTDTIAREGRLLTTVDARFNWPIFFSLGAMVTQAAGIPNAIHLQTWAAVASNLLYLAPLFVIFTALTPDRRLVWTAIFIFYAVAWVGQDYYSPQGFNYLLYLAILAIVLRWFRRPVTPQWVSRVVHWVDRRWPSLRAPSASVEVEVQPAVRATGLQRAILVGVIVLLAGVSIASHPLTPFAILAAVGALTVLRRTQLPGLPVLIAVAIGHWISYMTVDFLAGHLVGLLNDIGAPGESTSANVGQRLSGSPGHLFVVQFRLAATALFWMLAVAGAFRRFRHGHLDLDALALAAIPFGLLGLQAYGGEMLLRIYLFSLPFMAFLAAGAFFPTPTAGISWASTVRIAGVAAIMMLALMVTKHGNERADSISADEFAAASYLYSTAPRGSTVAAISTASPLRFTDFTEFRYLRVAQTFLEGDPQAMAHALHRDDQCAYLYISHSQQAYAEMFWGIDAEDWTSRVAALRDDPRFQAVYSSPDVLILLDLPAAAPCSEAFNVAN